VRLLHLTRLDLLHLTLQSGSRAALEQIYHLSALQCLQLGSGNSLSSERWLPNYGFKHHAAKQAAVLLDIARVCSISTCSSCKQQQCLV
jgi:hypothetical protein